jgi:hypothetical protein
MKHTTRRYTIRPRTMLLVAAAVAAAAFLAVSVIQVQDRLDDMSLSSTPMMEGQHGGER